MGLVGGDGGGAGGNGIWFTDFEGGSWPRTLGGTTLPNGILIQDDGGPRLVTEVGAGNPGQALAWHGGDMWYGFGTARFVIPYALDETRNSTLQLEAFLTTDGPGDIQLHAQRGACGPPVARTLRRDAWRTLIIAVNESTGRRITIRSPQRLRQYAPEATP